MPIVKQLIQEKDTYFKRIEEAAANKIFVKLEKNNITPILEFASEHARIGYILNELSTRILENEELASFVNKIGTKLCKEGVVNAFEKAIMSQVLENITYSKSRKVNIRESIDLEVFFNRYVLNY